MASSCINLKGRFGQRTRVRYAEDYLAEYGHKARVEDRWYMEIPCQNGTIGPWSESELVACTNTAGSVASPPRILALGSRAGAGRHTNR